MELYRLDVGPDNGEDPKVAKVRTMRLARLRDTPATAAGSEHFTGAVVRHDLAGVDEPMSSALLVRFEVGARTHWHRHPGGQYLYGVEGEGRVQSRDSEVTPLRPGDCVYAEPGEEHWHGAGENAPFAHLAISIGETQWGEPVHED